MSTPKNEQFIFVETINSSQDLHKSTSDHKGAWERVPYDYPTIQKDGEFIWKALYISVDPYLSAQIGSTLLSTSAKKKEKEVQISHVTAEVIESKNDKFPVGTIFVAHLPWRRYDVSNGTFARPYYKVVKKPGQPENVYDRLGLSASLGALGMPTQTAYYGVTHVGKFTPNDVVVVSGAAGATGSVAGQIAKKIQRAKKVIGIAGSDEKCKLLTEQLGFDVALNYKRYNTKESMAAALQEAAGGDKITAYYDNTGGHVTDAVFDVIARHGRIIICGQIEGYHGRDARSFPNYLGKTIYSAITVHGFLVNDFVHLNENDFFVHFPMWLESKDASTRIITHEHVYDGFDKLPEAYAGLFTGANIGKIIVKV